MEISDLIDYAKRNPLIVVGTVGGALLFVVLAGKRSPTYSNTEPQSVTYQIMPSTGGGSPGGSNNPPLPLPIPNPNPNWLDPPHYLEPDPNYRPEPLPIPEPTPGRPPPAACPPGLHWSNTERRCIPYQTPDIIEARDFLETMKQIN